MDLNNKIKLDIKIQKYPEEWKIVTNAIKQSKGYFIEIKPKEDKYTIFIIWVFPAEPKEKKEKMKQEDTQKIMDLILDLGIQIKSNHQSLNKKLDNHIVEFNSFKSDINKKLDNHIVEFNSFKSDMLEFKDDMLKFKSDMLSLPTISKEFKDVNVIYKES